MSDEPSKSSIVDKLTNLLKQLPWADILIELYQYLKKHIEDRWPKSPYEVISYESTLELHDAEGKHATFTKREEVRYLQNNIIAYQDQAWGDGEILVDYRCTPGEAVDCYRTGHKWHVLISRREVKNKGDTDVYNIEWQIRNGFLKPTGYWETHITHPTKQAEIHIVFPKERHPKHICFLETNRRRSRQMPMDNRCKLPDGRCRIIWQVKNPRLHETYLIQWEW